MKNSLRLRLFLITVLTGTCTTNGDELFGVYRPAFIDSVAGVGRQSSSVIWNYVNSLAKDDQGRLFSVSQGQLVQIDPYALTLTPVLTLNQLGGATGLAFSQAGDLFAVGGTSRGAGDTDPLYRIDTHTGDLTVVGDTGFYAIQDLAYSSEETLYGWSIASGLITIDQQTGRGTDVNPAVGAPAEIQALTFGADGTLYGARDALFKIDTATGVPERIGSGGYSDIRGLALIPEPSPSAHLAIATCGLLLVRAWRKGRAHGLGLRWFLKPVQGSRRW